MVNVNLPYMEHMGGIGRKRLRFTWNSYTILTILLHELLCILNGWSLVYRYQYKCTMINLYIKYIYIALMIYHSYKSIPY